ncbi:MAG TPA: HD domain-containing phosphohydrolase [Candidatus Acidoferrales bacterium]|nr:HD domain-containing phosphohydrolase [Candidatus Acidoferrales bacterium]
MPFELLRRFTNRRVRILWIVLGALLLVSVVPLWLYHRQVLRLSEEKLQDTERVQQTEITRSLAGETLEIESNLRQQLISLRQVLALTGWIQNVSDPAFTPQLTRLLQNYIENNPNILYVTALGKEARGQSAGSIRADDPFVDVDLKRSFTASVQQLNSVSGTFALGKDNRPVMVISVPLVSDGQFTGMLAAVVSLDRVLARLQDASVRDRLVYIVDKDGHIIVHPNTGEVVPGLDVSSKYSIVNQFKELPQELRATETTRFSVAENGRATEMIGTYSTIPELRWAVIAQRSLEKARIDAGVQELTAQALQFVVGVTILALIFGYLFALGISTPIRGLVESTRAISRAEFHERAEVGGAAEISELAETFNNMAGDIEQFVERLKQAAAENRELFLGSIKMLAAAIDEKDPYTRGHSGRVAKYSVFIGKELGLDEEELDRLRISALLHDVGKIGVDDQVLKKPGKLTDEEFEIMKQHPVKGANIMRPVAQLKEMLPGIELHHEFLNGKGYPYGLKGDEIPLMARIIAVADTFDAMTTNRPYQSAMEQDYALERIRSLAGTKFDPRIVSAIEAAIASGKIHLTSALVEV